MDNSSSGTASRIGRVELLHATPRPYENAVATALTCYSSKLVKVDEVSVNDAACAKRDRVAERTFKAGHHTTQQHNTFQFALHGVSRFLLWSFLHDHQHYNSEQVSQRYVKVRPDNVFVPPLSAAGTEIFLDASRRASETYARLTELLVPVAERAYAEVYPGRRRALAEEEPSGRWHREIRKKAQEISRYVLPIATLAHLHHTIPGLTLHRYRRIAEHPECRAEAALLIDAMVKEVEAHDPLFFTQASDPVPLEETAEFRMSRHCEEPRHGGEAISNVLGDCFVPPAAGLAMTDTDRWIRSFDAELESRTSLLVDPPSAPEATLARGIRAVLGLSPDALSDDRAIALALDPAENVHLCDTLNLSLHGKLTRPLVHVHFTFLKKLSLAADSQDQRHRAVPGSRPLLARQFRPHAPDYIVPVLLRNSGEAEAVYRGFMDSLWHSMRRLIDLGEDLDSVLYLLPNAFPVRFQESGDLLGLRHKWAMRLCYNAQEEIWHASRDETAQVRERFPEIGRWLLPPCSIRQRAGAAPYCPEGVAYCGVPVWRLEPEEYRRVI